MTPIFYATTYELVSLLLEWGANVNDVDVSLAHNTVKHVNDPERNYSSI